MSGFKRKTRSGRSFLEIVSDNNPDDIAILELDFAVDMDALVQKAVELSDAIEEPQVPATTPPSSPSPPKRTRNDEQGDDATQLPAKRASTLTLDQPKKQSSNNRRRAKRRSEIRKSDGHPRGSGLAFQKYLLSVIPVQTDLQSENLPIAEGGWVAANANYYGAKAKREVEDMKAKGFTHIPWKGRVPVVVVDGQSRVVLAAVGRPDDDSYVTATENMADLMLEMGVKTDWDKSEKHHVRGDFAYANYGWSYGKGQRQPQRLGGERQEMMHEFVSQRCTQRVAAFQSASFALWFPKSYGEFQRRNLQLKEKIHTFDGNIKGSVYSCCTANCGPNSWSHIHRDAKNAPGACCAITSGGPFDPTKGGQLIIWDLKIIIDFPPGSTILLPSALFRHSNTPIQKGEKRVSFTQYTAGGIHRWLEYGGRTEEAFEKEDPEGFQRMLTERPERWRKVLQMFSTIEELKAGIIA